MIFGRNKTSQTGHDSSSLPPDGNTTGGVASSGDIPAEPQNQPRTDKADRPASPEAGETAGTPSATDATLQARRAYGAKMMAASFGEIVTVLMRSASYRHFSLADLEWLVVPPVITQQFVLAEARRKEEDIPAPIAVALWARVSPEVDSKLSSIASGPLRLRPDEWRSGDIFWLIEAVGPRQVLDGLMENLHRKMLKGRPLKVRGIDKDGKPVIKIQKLPVSGEENTARPD